jgi:hypothetical protein
VFPAAQHPRALEDATAPQAHESDTACYYHPTKRAEAVCAVSGAFLCRLCAIEVSGETWSPQAFEEAVRAKRLPQFESDRPRFRQIAQVLGAVGLLLSLNPLPIGLFLGIGAIAAAVWASRSKGSLLDRERFSTAGAILLGTLAIAVNGFVLAALIGGFLNE